MTENQYSELVRYLGVKFDEVRRHADTLFEQSRADLRLAVERSDMRFEAVDRRFDAMDERLDGMDRRLDAMDRRFDAMDQRFDAMDRRFDAMDLRFDSLESEMRTGFTEHGGRISALERRN
ncbi:hypothetical protein [Gaopeijia maritima]|uniref:hypothetical protein n=1 Tax=Gaopeijia maritima TaxID=3119007 RepID=UPI00328451DE